MTLSVTNTFSAGTSIVASQMNANFNDIEAYINTTPGVITGTGGTVTGILNMTGGITVSGDATFDTTTFKVDAVNNRVGVFTATPNTFPPLYNGLATSPYTTESGGGGAGGDRSTRANYRLVVNGSVYVDGDIIGHTNRLANGTVDPNYVAGSGTRINTQWLNVRENVDISGDIRIQTSYDYARIYFGNDYSTNQDWLEWKDTLTGSNLPGFQFVHNDNVHLQISESGAAGSEKLDLRAYKASSGASQGGWPTLSGTTAVITTTGTEQLGISSSSIRFKEDVEDLQVDAAWSKINALRPRTFNWNEQVATSSGLDYESQIPELGFIAEEVAEAAPEATLYDFDGDPIVYREKSMLSLLVKAVQDLNTRMEGLE